jgi:hypothetical protein
LPLLVFPLALLAVVLAAIVLAPVSLVLRYRRGTARRRARRWMATLNVVTLACSLGMVLVTAAFAGLWTPHAFARSVAGAAVGAVLGLLGLAWTRWEPTAEGLHYTPPRALVLTITLVVAARLFYGLWRTAHAWHSGTTESWLAASGAIGSMAAGAGVLAYYVVYWAGVRRRLRRPSVVSRADRPNQ